MVTTFVWTLAALIVVERFVEIQLAAHNRRLALAAGGRERGQRHYPLIIGLHSAWFVAWIAEALWRGPLLHSLWPVWIGLFILGEALRYWCMASLGRYWNTRILVVPGAPLVRSGPYRFLHHPNYVGVVILLLAVPMIFGAWITALSATTANALLLLLVRIPEENRALAELRE